MKLMEAAPTNYGIYNLSSHSLTPYHISLLAKGLSFSPSSTPNRFDLFVDLNRYIRKLTLMRHFTLKGEQTQQPIFNTQEIECINALTSFLVESGNNTSNTSDNSTQIPVKFNTLVDPLNKRLVHDDQLFENPLLDITTHEEDMSLLIDHNPSSQTDPVSNTMYRPSPFAPKSIYFPYHSKGNFIDTFYTLVLGDLEKLCQNNLEIKHSNLTKEETITMLDIKNNFDLIVRQADKGGAIVLQDRVDYICEAHRLLHDSVSYTTLDEDPVMGYQIEFQNLLREALSKGIITNLEEKFLFTKHPRTPIFYHLPKLHKDKVNPPGRPIISGVGSMTSNLSQYIDYYLQPYVINLKSYIRDTLHVIDSTSDIIWKDTFHWITCDVSSLYTCIDHTKGIQAINHFFELDTNLHPSQKTFLLACIQFILSHNYFLFEDTYYLQICGTAMGTRFAPSYANLYMGLWERTHVWENASLRGGLVYYGRFIDDIIFIWDGDRDILEEILSSFNINEMGLKFTHTVHPSTIVFLDLELFIGTENQIQTRTHFKSVSANSYLHYGSNHYKKWLNNVPKSQFYRIRRNCSEDSDFASQGKDLSNKFLEKGYDASVVNKAFQDAGLIKRETLLEKSKNKSESLCISRKKEYKSNNAPKFITQFNQSAHQIRNILNCHWKIIRNDPVIGHLVPEYAPTVFRKARSIKTILAPSKLKTKKITNQNMALREGNVSCGRGRCLTCKHLTKSNKFTSHSNGTSYEIKDHINCLTEYVVYLISCECGTQYIGRTSRALSTRFLEHRRNIINGCQTHSLSRHFCTSHNKNPKSLSVMGIEFIPPSYMGGDRFQKLCTRETYWMYILDTTYPKGHNDHIDISTIV
ncbi:calcium uptake protein 2, mitochondrial isoform X1 [Ascaphus truei]|uniref:calcium uptake protein 2, mitochondrial isoform X1 n=1 Tax=Ascaphus truei TaxID=8439 RepID=UPI003F5A190A